ncbi:hypothetical protein C9183_22390, partial [Escherichia coli]
DRNRSHWSTSKTPSYTKSVSWQHHRSIGIGLSFGFCQILGRYTMSLGWSKYWGVLGVFPVTNIVLFLILIFFKKR